MTRRTLALGFIGGAIVLAALVVIVIGTGVNQTYRTAYAAVHDITAGATIADADVHTVRIPAGADGAGLNLVVDSPVGKRASHHIVAGAPLSPGDLLTSVGVEVPVAFKNSGDLHADDIVDVAAVENGRLVIIAKGLHLTGPASASVSPRDEVYWLALSSSGVSLYAARSTGLDVFVPVGGVSASDALQHLADQVNGGGGGVGSSASPKP
jgi:hypothetical protein